MNLSGEFPKHYLCIIESSYNKETYYAKEEISSQSLPHHFYIQSFSLAFNSGSGLGLLASKIYSFLPLCTGIINMHYQAFLHGLWMKASYTLCYLFSLVTIKNIIIYLSSYFKHEIHYSSPCSLHSRQHEHCGSRFTSNYVESHLILRSIL